MTTLLLFAVAALATGIAGLVLAGLRAYPPGPPPPPKALHAALPGCFMCVLSASAGDDYLDLHVRRDH